MVSQAGQSAVNTSAKATAAVFQTYGYIADAAYKSASAWSRAYEASANAGITEANANLIRYNAQNHLDDAAESIRMAGETQKSALDATTNRYLQLGQDIGHLYAGAAGGGIDVSSATVRHVDKGQRLMAQRDVAAINHSTAETGRAYNRQALAHRLSYVNDLTNASMMQIQSDYKKKIAQSQARNATWSAVAQAFANTGATWAMVPASGN